MTSPFYDFSVSSEDAEASIRSYTPGVQEDIEETPDEVDNSPITAEQRAALDAAHQSTLQSPFPADNQGISNRRVTVMAPDGEWVSPVIRDRQRLAKLLPSFAVLNDLDARITAVMRFDGAPKAVTDLAQKARLAVSAAREVRKDASHPDNPKYTRSIEAKDATVKAIADATAMVGNLERVAKESTDEWFANLTADLPALRARAAEALENAAKAYAEWRQSIAAAEALAKEKGMFHEWHMHPDSRELNPLALIGEVRKARDIAKSDDDWVNGDYLTKEYDGVPPHTMAALEKSARVAGGGSYAQQLLMRVKSPHPADGPVADAISTKDLRIIHTSPIPVLITKHENEL